MGRFSRIWIAAALLLGFVAPSFAGFEAGRDAYIRGDFSLAYQEFLTPAKDGDSKSRIGLGLLHARGHGVPRDLVKAHKWFDLAARQDKVEHPVVRILAKTNRDYLAKQMSPEQLAESRLQAALISPTYKGPAKTRARADESVARVPFTVHGAAIATPAKTRQVKAAAVERQGPEPSKPQIDRGKSTSATPVHIQLAALRQGEETEALTAWARMARHHNVLFGLAPKVSRVDLGAKGVFLRLRTGPFENRADARAVCKVLRDARQDCFVVRN